MTMAIEVEDLRVRYGLRGLASQEQLRRRFGGAKEFRAAYKHGIFDSVDGLTFALEGGKIYGLLGRNGAGKTTLLSVLAGLRRPTGGSVRVGGQPVFENSAVTREVCLVADSGGGGKHGWRSERVGDVMDFAACLRPHWDAAYAERLLGTFRLRPDMTVDQLSRGKQSAVRIVAGLASRAAVTLFDEPHLGLDAPSRLMFYDELLADFMAHPRTIMLSTHLVEEVARLFEQVVILDQGRLIAHQDIEELCAQGAAVTGPAEAVDRFTDGLTVLSDRRLGPTKSAMVYGDVKEANRNQARRAGLEIGPVSLQDLFVHLTDPDRSVT